MVLVPCFDILRSGVRLDIYPLCLGGLESREVRHLRRVTIHSARGGHSLVLGSIVSAIRMDLLKHLFPTFPRSSWL